MSDPPVRSKRCRGSYKNAQLARVLDRDGPLCRYCGVETVKARFASDVRPNVRTLDHVIAVARGGSNALANLAIACRFCNETKADGDRSAIAAQTTRPIGGAQ